MHACVLSRFSRVWLFVTPWTVFHQAPLSIGFSSQEYWSGLPCPSPGDLPDPGIEPVSPVAPALQADSLRLSHQGSPEIQVQFSSVAQLCLTLCDPMSCSMPGLLVHHQLPEPTQTHVHWVGNAIQLPHPLASPSLPALNLSQHQGLFKWVSSSHEMAKVLEFQLQHQSLQWTPRIDFF